MPTGFLLSDDLLFTSRIAGTARSLGLPLQTHRTVAALVAAAQDDKPACVIVDLHHPELDMARLVGAFKSAAGCTMVGYGSHVAADVLHQARAMGCDIVLPRSKFVETLADDLAKWYGVASAQPPDKPA